MAFAPGRSSVFKLDSSAGTLTDLTAYVTDVSVPSDRDMIETTTMGSGGARTFVPGLSGATLTISGKWDAALEAHIAGIANLTASQTFEYLPEGVGSGKRRTTAECFLISYEPPSNVEGVVEFSATFQITGTLTRDTQA